MRKLLQLLFTSNVPENTGECAATNVKSAMERNRLASQELEATVFDLLKENDRLRKKGINQNVIEIN